jgi:hypothetical protein
MVKKRIFIGIIVVSVIIAGYFVFQKSQQRGNPQTALVWNINGIQTIVEPNLTFSATRSSHIDTVQKGSAKVGFNPSVTFEPFPNGVITNESMDAITDLKIDVLRFPGGAIANKYHFYKTGYGRGNKNTPNVDRNYIEELVRLTQNISPEPDVLFVMNLFEHFPNKLGNVALKEENMAALRYLIDNGVNVTGVELGNELYLYREVIGFNMQNQNTISAKTRVYANLAREYTDMIHAEYPDLKMGIPFGNSRAISGHVWNMTLLDEDRNDKFIDAFIPHVYGEVAEQCGSTDMTCIKGSLERIMELKAGEVAFLSQNNYDVWITELSSINHGFDNLRRQELAFSDVKREYMKKYIEVFINNGADYLLIHRLLGPSEAPSYNYISYNKTTGETEKTILHNDFSKTTR